MSKAGRSSHDIGTRVRITGIVPEYDADLNGRTGSLCRPFHRFPIRDVGVWLDADPLQGLPEGPVTIHLNEYEVIEETN
jgi:hypothetical protein